MLYEFLAANRGAIIDRTRAKVAEQSNLQATEAALMNGVPLFLEQLTENLRLSKPSSEMSNKTAASHGIDMLRLGLNVSQVIHSYGKICQSVTELATEMQAPISADEFHDLSLCLDDAIAQAVSEYMRQRDRAIACAETERLGSLAHELRNRLNAAMLAFEILKSGSVAIGGSTGAVLGRNLESMRSLIERSLSEVRLEAGIQERKRVSVFELIEDVKVDASLAARARGIGLMVTPVEGGLYIDVDRQLLEAAVANLMQNAFKFSHTHGHVVLRTIATADRVMIEVEDECGGLAPGKLTDLFRPFQQRDADRTGLGLGLSISLKAVEASGGTIRVRDLPGKGCVFTIDLPRQPPP